MRVLRRLLPEISGESCDAPSQAVSDEITVEVGQGQVVGRGVANRLGASRRARSSSPPRRPRCRARAQPPSGPSAPPPLASLDLARQVDRAGSTGLQRASGIVDAVQSITNSATIDKDAAAAQVEAARQGTFSQSITSQRIRAWLGFGTDPTKPSTLNAANFNALQKWVNQHLAGAIPVASLISDAPGVENLRAQAIHDLNIP
jgi:hypothetical protein